MPPRRADLMIVVRHLEFRFDPSVVPRDWYAGDLHLTTFWNALSLLFPEGERFFVQSVRRFRDRVRDPALAAAVDAFVEQEAMHGKGHRAFNAMIRDRGLAVADVVERRLRRLLKTGRARQHPLSQLAVTCALEHFTAILAEQLLATEEHRNAAHESVRPLWVWHALEESEHKAVAFDVYRAAGGGYGRRARVMLLATACFFGVTFDAHLRFLHAQGELANLGGWARAIQYFWVRPGLFRRLVPAYLDYYRPDFHPEDRDTSALVRDWQRRLEGSSLEGVTAGF